MVQGERCLYEEIDSVFRSLTIVKYLLLYAISYASLY